MSVRGSIVLLPFVVACMLAGCSGTPSPSVEESEVAGEPRASMATELLVVEPPVAGPADRLTLRFPQETFRGLAFVLERRTGQGWETSYLMASDANGGTPSTEPAGTQDWAVQDVGIAGPGPDHVDLPEDIEPGEYRICTANAGEDFCVPLEITFDGLACDREMRESGVIDYEMDPEPSGATPVAAAESQRETLFGDDVTFHQVAPTELEVMRPDGARVGTVHVMATTGGFVVSGYTRCG